MTTFFNTILVGISSGSIYALMSLSLVLVWRSTRVVNFAAAGQAVLSTYLGYEAMSRLHNYWLSLPIAVIAGALISAIVESFVMRPLAKRSKGSPVESIAPVIATLGILGLIRGIAGLVWGNTFLQYTSPLSSKGFMIGHTTIPFSPLNAAIVIGAAIVLAIFAAIFRFTRLGLALRAASFQPEISRLSGIRVDRIRTIGWAFAGAAGALAGALVTPTTYLSPNSLDLLLVSGFVAAVIGGLESLIGAVVGGLVLGVGFAFILQYIGSEVTFSAAFIILIIVLFIRPQGIFGRGGSREA
jgi:branched-chain amino acid transport system permease protein